MKRGIVTLTKTEFDLGYALLAQETEPQWQYFRQKLSPITKDSATLELNEEEAELLLDRLPMPNLQEKPEIKSLRLKISQFLSSMRTSLAD